MAAEVVSLRRAIVARRTPLLAQVEMQRAAMEARDAASGWTASDSSLVKLYYTQLLQALGRRLKVQQPAVCTAIVYFRRLYCRCSLHEHDPLLMAPTALWMACKVEECMITAGSVVREMRGLRDETYEVAQLLDAEYVLLENLAFELIVVHPFEPLRHLLRAVASAGLGDAEHERQGSLVQAAWGLLNDCYRTDVVVCHPPDALALACVHVAGTLMAIPTHQWFPPGEELVCAALWDLYDRCTRLGPRELTTLDERLRAHWSAARPGGKGLG